MGKQEDQPKTLRIVRLESQNVKRLHAVDITPGDGGVITVGGKNGQGKTSLLDSIEYALSGGKSIPPAPVRRGQQNARIVVDLGDLVVKRTFTGQTTNLTVTTKDGYTVGSPQQVLDKLAGSKLMYDPLEFIRMPAKDQAKTLLGLLPGVTEKLAEIEAEHKVKYAERRDVGRDGENVKAQKDGLGPEAARPVAEVNVTLLSLELRKANEHNRACDTELATLNADRGEVERLKGYIKEDDAEIAALRKEIQVLEAASASRAKTIEASEAKFLTVEIPERIDTTSIESKLADADKINRMAVQHTRYKELDAQQTKHRERWMSLEARVKELENERLKIVADAQYPVPGLRWSEEGVIYNDLPFEQASGAEQLRVTVAMGAAMNSELRVLLIRDGSLLDEDSLKMLGDLAEQYDLQCWLERVSEGDECSVVIEDGSVIRADPSAVTINNTQTKLEINE